MTAACAAVLLAALAVAADDEGYGDPIVRFRRELDSLRRARAEVQTRIDDATQAVRQNPAGFYQSHQAECEKTNVRPDGSFDFVYLPAREWSARKKRFDAAIAEKERELLAAYEEAIRRLDEQRQRLSRRWEAWSVSIVRLKAVEKDLKAQEEEWRKTMLLAGWDFVNEFGPAMKEGLNGLGVRLMRPPQGSFWSTVDLDTRRKLNRSIDLLELSSSVLMHATKALFSGVDAAREKNANEAAKKAIEAGQEVFEAFADVLKEAAVGRTQEQLAEFAQARAAVSAFLAITRAGSVLAAGGKLDDASKVELGNAGLAIFKFAGTFNPLVKTATLVYGTGAAALETGIAASAWWTVFSAERTNQDNLEWARRMTAAAREDHEAVAARLDAYRRETAALQKGAPK